MKTKSYKCKKFLFGRGLWSSTIMLKAGLTSTLAKVPHSLIQPNFDTPVESHNFPR